MPDLTATALPAPPAAAPGSGSAALRAAGKGPAALHALDEGSAALRAPARDAPGLDAERERLRDDVHDRLAPLVAGLAFGLAGLRGSVRAGGTPPS